MKPKAFFFVFIISTMFSTFIIAQDINKGAANDASLVQCQRTWQVLRQHLLNKDLVKSMAFFTDSLSKNFKSYEVSSLKALITEKWFNDPYFIKSIKSESYNFQKRGNSNYRIRISVSYPKQKGEEGDGRIVYVLDFKQYQSGYKVYMINIAG